MVNTQRDGRRIGAQRTHQPHPTGSPSLHFALPAVVVHRALRRETRLAGSLVSRVPVGDTARAHIVGHHLDLLLRALRHHHELEDSQIWPLLRARLPVGVRQNIVVMEDQHRHIDQLVHRITQLLAAWPTNPAAVAAFRGPLAEQLDTLHELLTVHLDLEEQVVLPLAEQHLTPVEWAEIGRLAEAGHPRAERALVFGMLQYDGDPAVIASMLAAAPLPIRLLLPRLARRAYRRHCVAVHGTATP